MASKGRGSRSRRGNAAQLKAYWSTGAGSTKIRWNTRGDHTRCSKRLAKYLGPRAKAYCARLHYERTGVWSGDRRNVGRRRTR